MKKTFKVIAAIFALGGIILLLLHVFLLFGLTKTMREAVLPQIKEQTGLDVRVGGLSINIPNGRMVLESVEVRNPEGFLLENALSVGRINLELDMATLVSSEPILIRDVSVDDVRLNVIRNRDGEFNVIKLQEGLPGVPVQESGAERVEPTMNENAPEQQAAPLEIPEILLEQLRFGVVLRYLDFKLDDLDIALDLAVSGEKLSTLHDPEAEWGALEITGSLGDDETRFVTELLLALAPVTDPAAPSFDLTGRIMEIDPVLMENIYDELRIRSAPFGFDPEIHCRAGLFEDSSFALNLSNIELEDKLSDDLGGMTTIEALHFSVPLEGSLEKPKAGVKDALLGSLGGNVGNLFSAFIKGAAAKEAGLDEVPENLADAAVEVLGKHVEEIGEHEAVKKVLKDLAGGEASDTNAPAPAVTDVLIDILGDEVEEIGDDDALKQGLKDLGRALFGK